MANFHGIKDAKTGETTIIPFTAEEEAEALASQAAAAIRQAAREAEITRRQAVKIDVFVQQFLDMTPAQTITYVNNTPEKQVLAKILMILQPIAKEQYK